MTVESPAFRTTLTRILCIIVLAVMVIAATYAGWIAVSNFARIRV